MNAQGYLLPMIGRTFPMEAPTLESVRIESQPGWLFGVDLRSGRTPVYFNPAFYLVHERIHIKEASDFNPSLLHKTKGTWVKIRCGVSAVILGNPQKINLHMHGGLTPGILLSRPVFDSFEHINSHYRTLNIEFHLGLGMDIKNLVIRTDFHQRLVRRINTTDIVENEIALVVGWRFLGNKSQEF